MIASLGGGQTEEEMMTNTHVDVADVADDADDAVVAVVAVLLVLSHDDPTTPT